MYAVDGTMSVLHLVLITVCIITAAATADLALVAYRQSPLEATRVSV